MTIYVQNRRLLTPYFQTLVMGRKSLTRTGMKLTDSMKVCDEDPQSARTANGLSQLSALSITRIEVRA